MLIRLFLLLFTFSILAGCEPNRVKSITPTELEDMVNDSEEFHLIDLRNKTSFDKEHLKGAINVIFDDQFLINMKEFDKDKTVVLYAENNDESMNASMLLFDEDFKLVYFFLNEYSSWKNDININ